MVVDPEDPKAPAPAPALKPEPKQNKAKVRQGVSGISGKRPNSTNAAQSAVVAVGPAAASAGLEFATPETHHLSTSGPSPLGRVLRVYRFSWT